MKAAVSAIATSQQVRTYICAFPCLTVLAVKYNLFRGKMEVDSQFYFILIIQVYQTASKRGLFKILKNSLKQTLFC
jgi:hypothetical protein